MMEKEKNMERVYSFIEKFDFEVLSESEKDFVLSQISHVDYINLRSTIVDTKTLFANYPNSSKGRTFTKIKQFVLFPIELYKIAAVLLLFFGTAYFVSIFHPSDQKEFMALVDTIYLTKPDTIIIERVDTIEIIKEKVVVKDILANQYLAPQTNNSIKTENHQTDCAIDICPDDMALLSKIKTKGNISQDTSITDFIVSLN